MVSVPRPEPWRQRLYLPAYRIGEAARYARTTSQSVAYWHYHRGTPGAVLPREEKGAPLSYLELIEVALVAVFRQLGVPLRQIRRAREYAIQRFQMEYPFAQYQFRTDGFHLLMDLRHFDPKDGYTKLIVADSGGQLGWRSLIEDRLGEFDYEYDLALRWHVAGRASPVVIDPRIAFGAPAVRGIPTRILKGRIEAGESVEDIRQDFPLSLEEIRGALEFEGVAA